MRVPSPSASLYSACGSLDLTDAEMLLGDDDDTIKVTVNTLLGGAFLLDVDPLTSVRQVKDILSQMQSIPISQQNLVFRRRTLHDDALLSHCGVQDGSSLSLVLGINSALTNVMVTNEPISEPECATDLFELDAMDMLDITGMSDGEQDELLSLLFGHNIDPNDKKQGFILCRDGDKISMLHLGSASASTRGGLDSVTPSGRSRSDRSMASSSRAALDPTADHNSLQQRLQRLQENTRHRIRMTELQIKSEQRKDKRSRRSSRRAAAEAAEAAARGEGECMSSSLSTETGTGTLGTDEAVGAAAAAGDGDFLTETMLDVVHDSSQGTDVSSDGAGPTFDLDAELSGGPAAEYEAAAAAAAAGERRRNHGEASPLLPPPLYKNQDKTCLPAITPTGKRPHNASPIGKGLMTPSPPRPSHPGPPSPLATRHDETPPGGGRSSRLLQRRDAGPLGGLTREPSIGHVPSMTHPMAHPRRGRSKSAKSSVARSLTPDLFSLDFGYGCESSVESSLGGHTEFDAGHFDRQAAPSRVARAQESAGAHRTALPRLTSLAAPSSAAGKGKLIAGSPLAQQRWAPTAMATKGPSLPSIGNHGLPKLIGPSDPDAKQRCIKIPGRGEKPASSAAPPQAEAKKDVCTHCARRLKITSTYHCRCGGTFCGRHRHSESHSCSFDYKTSGRQMLATATTKVEPPKLPKI